MKSVSGWEFKDKTYNGTDEFSFNVLPSGPRNSALDSLYAIYWSTTTHDNKHVYAIYVKQDDNVDKYDDATDYLNKKLNFAVRCIAD